MLVQSDDRSIDHGVLETWIFRQKLEVRFILRKRR